MRPDPRWSYVQARLQARHADMLVERDWHALDAARTLEHFLDRTRASALRRFTAPLNAGMSSHEIERMLRQSWRDYVAEIGGWLPREWQGCVFWVAVVADLPAIDALLRGETPAWAGADPVLADLANRRQGAAVLERSWLAPLLPGASPESTLAGRWNAHWRSLWPAGAWRRGLDALAAAFGSHFEMLERAAAQDTSAPYRRSLAQQLTRMFRRHRASPIAVVAHLGLVALELVRLRGSLVHRRLFGQLVEAA